MYNNSYEGVLDDWKVKLIRRRARRLGFSRFDTDDALQRIVLVLVDFKFDAARSNGACEETVLTAVIDRQLAMIRRGEARLKRHARQAPVQPESYCEQPELRLDVQRAIESLPDVDQRICRELALGRSINEVATTLELHWHSVRSRMDAIQRHFERLGLSLQTPGFLEAVA